MVNFIALDNEIADWRFRVCTVNGDAKAVGALSRPQLDGGILLYVMHVVLQNFDVRTPSKYPNPARNAVGVVRSIIANFETLNPHVGHVAQFTLELHRA